MQIDVTCEAPIHTAAQTMAKRKFSEMEVSDLQVGTSATVHGVFVGPVSPVKCSRKRADIKFFEGQLTDGKKTVRVVSFEPKLRREVEQARESGEGVAVTNCCVQKSKKPGCDSFEIVAGNHTSLAKSPKKFRIDEEIHSASANLFPSMDVLSLEKVEDLAENQHINVTGKVQTIGASEQIHIKSRGQTLTKADFVLADCTAVCRGVAWEDHIAELKEKHSYKLKDVTVRSFNKVKYLSLGENSSIEKIPDIGEVVDDVVADGVGGAKVIKGEIVGVLACDAYSSCRSCKAKVIKKNEVMGECSKCGMKMKMARCGKSMAVRLIIEDDDGNEHKATAFTEVVQRIIQGVDAGSDVEEKMLSAPLMNFTISTKDTVSSVTKILN